MAADSSQESITGTLERILYANEENHYTVASLQPENRREPITVVGNLASVQCGEILKLTGRWTTHKQFGRQFQVEKFESVLPATVTGIKKYLGSGLIKGIGPKFADRIVNHFGDRTLEVIDQFSAKLRDVDGIGPERARRIRAAWVEQKAIRDIMIFLQSYGISSSQAAKIYKQYGNDAMQVVKANPYQLARDIHGIGFKTADAIAANMGVPADSPRRIRAGILHVLEELTDDGHTCCPHNELCQQTAALLTVGDDKVKAEVLSLAADRDIVIEDDLIFLSRMLRAETDLAARLLALTQAPLGLPEIKLDLALKWFEEKNDIALASAQREAIKTALTSKLTVITGGPGVGKTTITRAIVKILRAKECRVLLASPTGRAAKRLSESTGAIAQTIHRLLKYDAATHGFVHNERKALNCDLLIVDEASMLDLPLACQLMKAVPMSASLVLVGDVDQLPSVGPGNVLRDIIESRAGRTVRLTEIYRQDKASHIVVNAHLVNSGQMPAADTKVGADTAPLTDFYFIKQDDPEKVLQTIIALVSDRIPKRFGFEPFDDIQVLAPMHRGVCGVENINRQLQGALNPVGAKFSLKLNEQQVERYGRVYRVRDKVMQIKNNYDKDVFNGDLGRIEAIDPVEQTLSVTMDDRAVIYDFTDLDELLPAYCISIHKSQGSEYPAVIVPVLTQHYVMLQRNLLYTAITRARKLVVLIGSTKALSIAVRNNNTAARYTRLRHRLQAG
ncbi:MAG: ATP-dependent RecD-like DNA helicase [Verrucomicrobia bacterium]|nr:ATP-dependent RecD-like DNA helicase [Verrucomicrobiota bacterium]